LMGDTVITPVTANICDIMANNSCYLLIPAMSNNLWKFQQSMDSTKFHRRTTS
jgi:hypothetical protein